MPCLSYDTQWVFDEHRVTRAKNTADVLALKSECDRLARIACKALTALETHDPELKDFKDRETKTWWKAHKKADAERVAKEEKEKAKKAEQERLRKEALAKLTPEEIEAFGLDKSKPKKATPANAPANPRWPGF